MAEQTIVFQEGQTHLFTVIVEISDEEETINTSWISPIPFWISSLSNLEFVTICDMDDYEQIFVSHVNNISPIFEPLWCEYMFIYLL